ncbi:MAG: chromosome segregation protein SMC [Planctomycetes bacterium]|nr:chromosome segregation protein SMC [Planctomycetota bacterium]MCB9918951.1 chromosome segregation protein SMC [Planctomycetota bacterium]
MKLKSLTLQGFKSFADKTGFDFGDGLTGIIGPNGCGKSNVVDAMKWVLGDQRPSSQRGKEMLDVVFHGAEGRPAMGCAQVTLVLERETVDVATATPEPIEMSIARRLYRSGESEYLLDGRVVRLKDVKEALLDTGLGVGGYSVMEQGRIDAVLSANPDERRSIFDEAAGISRYKVRRKEALRKLDRVELNLGRVQDLRQEKASRVRSLKIQATKARSWREANERLVALRVSVAVLDSIELRAKLDSVDIELESLEARIRAAETGRVEARRELAEVEEDARALSSRHSELRDLVASLRAEERSRREALEASEKRLLELRDLQARDAITSEETLALLDARRLELEDLQAGENELRARLEAAIDDVPSRTEAAKTARDRFREQQRVDERLSQRMLELMHDKTRARNIVRQEEIEGGAIRVRQEALREQVDTLEQRLATVRLEAIAGARECDDLTERHDRARAELERKIDEIRAHAADKDAVVQRSHAHARERSSLVSRIELLKDLEASYTGIDEAAKSLLGDDDGKQNGILARVALCIDFPIELGPALEAVLGPRVQALVVEDRARVDAALAQLEANKGARLALVDASRFGPRSSTNRADGATQDERGEHAADAKPLPDALPREGVPIADYCRFKEPAKALLADALAGVLLVPDLDAAYAAGERCVTLRGETVDGAWIQAGCAEVAASPLQRRSQLEHLSGRLEIVDRELEATRHEESSLDHVLEQHGAGRRRLEAMVESLDKNLTAATHAQQTRQARERETIEELELRRKELVRLEGQSITSLGARMHPIMNLVLLDRRERETLALQREARTALTGLDRDVHETQDRLAEAQTRKAGLDAEMRGRDQQRALLGAAIEDLEKRRRELERRSVSSTREHDETVSRIEQLRIEVVDFGCRAQAVEDIVQQASENLRELEAARDEGRRSVQEIESEYESAREARSTVYLRNQETSMRLERLDSEVYEDCGIELARLRGEVEGRGIWSEREVAGPELPPSGPVFERVVNSSLQGPTLPPDYWLPELELERLWEQDDFDRDEARKEAGVLRVRMQRMGAINLDAERELAEAERQFDQLERDCVDLEKAKRELIDAIHQINLESRKLFEETFHLARKNFQEIFRKLFQGGKADIELVETDDPLDAGIEIFARPPGKELRSIRLLSGGERSMTALAILFAVFQIRPSPFCILDEVDAALDEANVERFLRVLHDFTKETQFLVVTHHKRTMADCRVLYGVTMPRKGISSRMSVSLEDVESGAVDDVLDEGAASEAHVARIRTVDAEVPVRKPAARSKGAKKRTQDENVEATAEA